MSENTKTPRIRFKGFTDAWEQRKVCNLVNRFDNLRVPVTASARIAGRTPYYGANGIQDYVEGFTHEGEFILIAEDGANDLKNYPVQHVNGQIWVNNHAHVLQATPENSNLFLRYCISIAGVETLLVGGSRAKLNAETLMQMELIVPQYKEQSTIGKLFSKFDNLITLHQRKCDKLKNIKAALLEKMFPQGDATTPKIRFKGFTDAWEQRKAETLFISFVEKGFPDLPVLSATQDKGMVYRDDSGKMVFHDKNNEIGYKRVQPGQFVIHLRSFQGGFAHSNILGITSPAYTIFGFKEGESQYDLFWKSIFSSPDFIRRLESVTYGIRDGRSISYDEFLTMKFFIPKYNEQVKIATCLMKIDNLITLHQRKVEKLKNIKSALLEKMFV